MDKQQAIALLDTLDEYSSYTNYISTFANENGESYIFHYTPPDKFSAHPTSDSLKARILGSETDYEWLEITDTFMAIESSRPGVNYKVAKGDGGVWNVTGAEALWIKACFQACRPRHDHLGKKANTDAV